MASVSMTLPPGVAGQLPGSLSHGLTQTCFFEGHG